MSDHPVPPTETLPDEIDDVPPSAKLVLTVLKREGDLTQPQLAEETMLSPRTVRYAVTKLEERDLVASRTSFMDARQRVYSLDDDRFGDSVSP